MKTLTKTFCVVAKYTHINNIVPTKEIALNYITKLCKSEIDLYISTDDEQISVIDRIWVIIPDLCLYEINALLKISNETFRNKNTVKENKLEDKTYMEMGN